MKAGGLCEKRRSRGEGAKDRAWNAEIWVVLVLVVVPVEEDGGVVGEDPKLGQRKGRGMGRGLVMMMMLGEGRFPRGARERVLFADV